MEKKTRTQHSIILCIFIMRPAQFCKPRFGDVVLHLVFFFPVFKLCWRLCSDAHDVPATENSEYLYCTICYGWCADVWFWPLLGEWEGGFIELCGCGRLSVIASQWVYVNVNVRLACRADPWSRSFRSDRSCISRAQIGLRSVLFHFRSTHAVYFNTYIFIQ